MNFSPYIYIYITKLRCYYYIIILLLFLLLISHIWHTRNSVLFSLKKATVILILSPVIIWAFILWVINSLFSSLLCLTILQVKKAITSLEFYKSSPYIKHVFSRCFALGLCVLRKRFSNDLMTIRSGTKDVFPQKKSGIGCLFSLLVTYLIWASNLISIFENIVRT